MLITFNKNYDILNYFQYEIFKIIQLKNINVSIESSLYLSSLLIQYLRSENLFTEIEGKKITEPLVDILIRSLGCENNSCKIKELKKIGDISLFKVGVFKKQVDNSMLNQDYYINMGISAYKSISYLNKKRHISLHNHLYDNLSIDFKNLVKITNLLFYDNNKYRG
jgi:hypothetical protein